MVTVRPQKITFADMREQGVRGLLVYRADYRCSHSIAISGDRWPYWCFCSCSTAAFRRQVATISSFFSARLRQDADPSRL
jgi:hypothetical protein